MFKFNLYLTKEQQFNGLCVGVEDSNQTLLYISLTNLRLRRRVSSLQREYRKLIDDGISSKVNFKAVNNTRFYLCKLLLNNKNINLIWLMLLHLLGVFWNLDQVLMQNRIGPVGQGPLLSISQMLLIGT